MMVIIDRLADVTIQLNHRGYTVTHDALGYIVQHATDVLDRSRVSTLNELVDFANVTEWTTQRQEARDAAALHHTDGQ